LVAGARAAGTGFSVVGHGVVVVVDKEVSDMIDAVDADGSRTLDFDEFLTIFDKMKTGELKRKAFSDMLAEVVEAMMMMMNEMGDED